MKFFGLLHVAEDSSAVNCDVKDKESIIRVYVENAVALSRSLKCSGDFTLLTNDVELVKNIAPELDCLPCNFDLNVPEGIAFRSAHYKLDVFKYFSTLSDPYVFLVDLDVLGLCACPVAISNIVSRKVPVYYDISDQVIPAYGSERILDDMKLLDPDAFEGRWAGGELIGGTPLFFTELCESLRDVWDRYIVSCRNLHHQGDEMLVSVALEAMRRRGVYMIDIGVLGGVGRYWSGSVKHVQKRFEYFSNNVWLLHIPQDKVFISRCLAKGLDFCRKKDVVSAYIKYLRLRPFGKIASKVCGLFSR